MKDLYQKIETYFRFEKSDSVFVSLFKSVVLMGSGAYLGLVLREINSTPQVVSVKHILIFILGVSVFIFLESRRLKKEKNFPVTILEHLNAREDLKELQEKYSRISKIYGYIDNSIQSLNSNTCPVVTSPENYLCHQDLHEGLKNVLYDLVERPNYFFDIDKTQFSIGVYLKDVNDRDSKVGVLESIEKIFLFRDDLLLNEYIPETFQNINSSEEGTFHIQAGVIESLKLSKYLCKKISFNGNTYSLVCSPIPNVCEDCPADGVMYTIYKGEECCSSDSENVLLIFGRILSNWISKYNDCVIREKKISFGEIPPPVVVDLNLKSELIEGLNKPNS